MNAIAITLNYTTESGMFVNRFEIHFRDWVKAVESAVAAKDIAALNEIEARQGRNPEIGQLVKQMKAKLGV